MSILVSCGEGDGPAPVLDTVLPDENAYTLVWADEFDVDGAPNVKNWTMETGYGDNGWGNQEWQLYTDDTDSSDNNVRVEGGNLIITARCSGTSAECADGAAADKTGMITSARLNSKDKFEIKYGKIQARIKVPPGKGTWPAFWMLGSNFPEQPWPGAGEIDIMEIHQFFSNINTTHFTIHWCDEELTAPDECLFANGGRVFDEQFKEFDFALSDDYHVFEAVWNENNIVGKMDGITYFRASIDPGTQEEFLKSFFTILNLAVGGTLGGPPSPSLTWPQEMLVDWVRVYERNRPDVLELVPDDPEAQQPYNRFVNSVEFGGDSVVAQVQRTLPEDDEDYDPDSQPQVPPLTGGTIVELDYQNANTFFSGAAFEFRLKDVTHYDKFVFSLDTSAFPDFDDINIEIQDDRFTGDGAPGKTVIPLSSLDPPTVSGNWQTYTIPLTDFSFTNLENVALLGFWNPNNAADELIAGKLYLDNIKFVREPCSANGTVSFTSGTIAGNAGATQITVTDSCLANKSKTVVVLVENGTESIGVSVPIIASGQGVATVNFGPTEDATSTIAVQEGVTLTATYTDANGVDQSATATISTEPLAVFSETKANKLTYDGITSTDTVTDEASAAVSALEGSISLEAVYAVPSGSENGFAFDFPDRSGGLLVNGGFELPDASGGDFGIFPCDGIGDIGAPGWNTFNCNFIVAAPQLNTVPEPHGGSQVLKQFGADPGAQQSVAVSPGDSVTASAYAMNFAADPFNDLAILQLTFFDASDNNIGGGQVLARPDNSEDYQLAPKPGTASDWTRMEVTAVAPAGTVRAQVLVIQADVQIGGVLFWDDVNLTVSGTTQESNDVSYYQTLKFGINTTAAGSLMDLEVRMQDASAGVASVFLSNYTPTAAAVAGWNIYEIPLNAFTGLDLTDIRALGFYNASSTISAPPSGAVTHFAGTLYFDDVHFSLDLPAVQTGILLNSPIEGAVFSTDTQSGTTNSAGEFQYIQGEMITFRIGDIVLGPVLAGPVITPVELSGSVNPTDQSAVNMLVFLQSIDANQDPSDGITISAATQAAAIGQTLDFTLDSTAFTAAVTAVVNAIAPGNAVVTETDAVNNFYQTFPPTGSAATTTISASPATVDADGLDASTITVQARDSSGNNITVSAGTVTLSATGNAVVSSPVMDNGDGTYTATITNASPETVTITGTIAGSAIADTAIVTFIGAVSGANTTIDATSPVEADGISTSTITVQAKDANGNNFVKSAGSLVLNSSGSGIIENITDLNDGTYIATVRDSVAETVTITGTIAGAPIVDDATVEFVIGAVDATQTTITATPISVINNGIATSLITVQAKDTGGNDITSSAGVVTLSNSGNGIIENLNDNNDGTYTATVRNTTAEEVTITGTIAGNAIVDDATVTFGPAVAVFSDTSADSTLAVTEIIETVSGCNLTATTDLTSSTYPPYEGANLKQADYISMSNNCNGFVFNFLTPAGNAFQGYSQDFEGLNIADPGALGTSGGDGYLVFADVWDGDVGTGIFKYQYGPFSAPNGGPGFSAIATGEGGPDQGSQYLNIYSDYNNADHGDTGTCTVNANTCTINTSVFHEHMLVAEDVNGATWTFSGDYKSPASNGIANPASNATANAFIKTLDPGSGFSTTNLIEFDSTTADPNIWGSFSISIELSDPLLEGQILQFGFNTVATNFEDSGVFYDNLEFSVLPIDISGYATLKFAVDSSLAVSPALVDLEVKLEDSASGTASVFLSDYTPMPAGIVGASWDVYEIPLSDFTGTLDPAIVTTLGFYNASSTVTGSTSVPPTLIDASLYFDDVHFIE